MLSFFQRNRENNQEKTAEGVRRSRERWFGRILGVLRSSDLDEATWEELEEILISADVGIDTSLRIIEELRSQIREEGIVDAEAAFDRLKQTIARDLETGSSPTAWLEAPPPETPYVILMVGVNGSGKTTSAAKLAQASLARGEKVLFAAGDTFRAAAAEQLEVWGERLGIEVVRRPSGGDPAALVFDAVQAAGARGVDHLIVDTAGRLHTRGQLMEELSKVHRVTRRAAGDAWNIFTLLVVDAGNGHNALVQAREFGATVPIDAVFLAKLDGTAKGGMAVAIARDLRLPVAYLGVGEGVEDIVDYKPRSFAAALFG